MDSDNHGNRFCLPSISESEAYLRIQWGYANLTSIIWWNSIQIEILHQQL